jgi:hypothetical protein
LIDGQVLQNSLPEARDPDPTITKIPMELIDPSYRFNMAGFSQINIGG